MKRVLLCLLTLALSIPSIHAEREAESPVPVSTFGAENVAFISLTRRPTLESKLPTNVSRINGDDIRRSGAANAAEALRLVPGVDLQKTGDVGTFTKVRIRGVPASNQVQVIVDDQPVGGVSVQEINLALIPVENIERIEVIRGGSSILYGANAMGGLIHIITKNGFNAPGVSLGYESRSHNTEILSANAGASVGGWNALVTGNRIASNGYVEHSDLDGRTATGKLGYRWENGAGIEGSTSYTDQELLSPSGVSVPRSAWNGDIERESPISRTEKVDNEIFRNQLTATTPDLGFGSIKSTLYRQSEQYYIDSNDFGPFESWFKNRVEGADVRLLSNVGLTFGGAYERDTRESLGQVPHHIVDWAVYAEQDITVGKLTLLPALRLDQHSAFGNQYNPRLAAVYRVNPNWKFSGSAARSFRSPTLTDLYEDFPDPFGFGFDFFGNPNLEPEIAWSYDAGTQFAPMDWLEVGLTGFYTKLSDRIGGVDTNGNFASDTLANLGSAETNGAELELKAQTGWVNHRAAYTYQRARGTSAGNEGYTALRLTPNHLASYRAAVVMPWGTEFVNTFEYQSQQYEADGALGDKLPAYSLWHVRLEQRWKMITGYVGVNNVMDRLHADSFAFGNAFPQPGRVYLAGGKVAFGGPQKN